MTLPLDSLGMRHLAIVAHHDDDLLFMHTDLRKVIDAGGCLRIVYMTASDASRGPSYANERELGVESAYWSAVDPAGWKAVSDPLVAQAEGAAASRSSYADAMRAYLAGHNVWTEVVRDELNPMKRVLALTGKERMSVQFLRVVSCIHHAPATEGRTKLYNLERGLNYDGQPTAAEAISDVDGKHTYTRSQIVEMLRSIITDYKPTAIHYQAPESAVPMGWPWPFPHGADHPDHIATARMAREAAVVAGYEARIVQHVCYPSKQRQPNAGTKEASDSRATFQAYARFDDNYGGAVTISDSSWSGLQESSWVQRNHYAQRPRMPGGVATRASGPPVLFVTGEQTSGAHYVIDDGTSNVAWSPLGGRIVRSPVPFRFSDGRLGVLGVSGDSILYFRAQKQDGTWWDWHSFDGPVESDPVMAALADGRLATVFRAGNGLLRFTHEANANGNWIGSWKAIRPESGTGIGRPAVARSGSDWLVASLLSDSSVEYLFGAPDTLGGTGSPAPVWAKVPGWSVPTDTELALLSLPNNKIRLYGVGVTRAVWSSDFDSSTRTWTPGVQVKATEDRAGFCFAVVHVTKLGPVFAQLLQKGDVRVVIGDRVEYLGGNSLSLLGVTAVGDDAVTVYARGDETDRQTVYARTVRAQGMDAWRALGALTDQGAAPFSTTGLITRLTTAG